MSRDEWVKKLPPAPTVKQAAAAMREAYAYGAATVRKARDTFQGGTLPPPPWPATPELVAAMEDAKKAIDGMSVYETMAPSAKVPPPTVERGRAIGERVFVEADKLRGRAELVAQRKPTPAGAKKAASAAASSIVHRLGLDTIPPWVIVAGLVYLAYRER